MHIIHVLFPTMPTAYMPYLHVHVVWTAEAALGFIPANNLGLKLSGIVLHVHGHPC